MTHVEEWLERDGHDSRATNPAVEAGPDRPGKWRCARCKKWWDIMNAGYACKCGNKKKPKKRAPKRPAFDPAGPCPGCGRPMTPKRGFAWRGRTVVSQCTSHLVECKESYFDRDGWRSPAGYRGWLPLLLP